MKFSIQAIPAPVHRGDAQIEWILTDLPAQANVLEVGAGSGEGDYSKRIFETGSWVVGVDPDPAVNDNPYLHEHYQTTLEAFSSEYRARQFDVVHCHMVLEHIEHPAIFLSGVWRLLRPGGSFFGVTPNFLHYFGMVSFVAERLGIQDWLLRRLRGNAKIESYHFRAVYRMNTVWALRSLFRQVGATHLDIRMLESPPDFACYFPKALKFIPHLHSSLVYALRLYPFMGTILLRAVKSQ